MASKHDLPENIKLKIAEVLKASYVNALEVFNNDNDSDFGLEKPIINYLDDMTAKAEAASAAFTNIITGLAIKLAMPELDVRYHQTQIQGQSKAGKTWFNHRGVSEKIVYPWLSSKHFCGAKSGWQTRTLERPKPYTREYDENISHVKKSFLEIYESTNESDIAVINGQIKYLILKQIVLRESRNIDLATPNIDEIATIVNHLKKHINYHYTGKGGSRLPVLAVYATLRLVSEDIARYKSVELKQLEEHSAADSQTGSAGDIEFADHQGTVSEALEIKHGITITKELIADVEKKISPFQLERYYVLTTSENCKPDNEMLIQLNQIKQRIGCQVIVNGVFPTIQYYLRLVSEPQKVYKELKFHRF